ncbi:MAG: hypothetical protein LAT62_10585 [Natronospirillum sp.]|uniref:DUF6901 family protein n=1 Tax=Natronospirillum sp. TaxID=2812955 RepID=UPI0025E5A1CA|nr:hypothetical protein [Natronospirillum sp.]MCH8552374.1 hypothetical protein [Natronospirillum sp.]
MAFHYQFDIPGHADRLEYVIATDRGERGTTRAAKPAKWTRLSYHQCSNCPLDKDTHEHCPAAVDIQKVVEDFSQLPATQKVGVTVDSPARQYYKHTGLEEGLRSLMGLLMANCSCPILNKLKPMAYTHLPFASQEEFIIRSVGTYLLRQYFHHQADRGADWTLTGLVELNNELQLVNQAMWQRVNAGCEGESNLKALLSFFAMASSVSYSLEAQLQKVRHAFMAESDITPYEVLPSADKR